MQAQPVQTRAQVEQYLAQIYPSRQHTILETEFGWVARPILTPEELESGQGLGLGNYVVNKQTGVVTAHRSLPPNLIGEEYDEAIRNGQPIPGYQVYPPVWRVQVDRTRETPQEIEYQVRATPLTEPQQPPINDQLVINKQTLESRTSTPARHPACQEALAWTEWRSRQDGTWPQTGTFEF
ncbi:hypothetical protein [Nocardia cyriacigeorgica]|jgi:hypothetical protein|uniref:hypothetical protein n=1 Tax=Nocardia cyriacigeorgica TaxID=135487 RepID=UPI0021572161|nr:hypothetical protein [Nocardia cyriacigeorgica]